MKLYFLRVSGVRIPLAGMTFPKFYVTFTAPDDDAAGRLVDRILDKAKKLPMTTWGAVSWGLIAPVTPDMDLTK